MNRCILHVGMPKTATSSIQESLYFGMRSPGFHYQSFGEVTSNRWMTTLFGERPEAAHYNRKLGLAENTVSALRDSFRNRLTRFLDQARKRKKTIIISAEECWQMSRMEFQRIRSFFHEHGFDVHVFVSLRPWKSWLESAFQERVKQDVSLFEVIPPSCPQVVDYRGQLSILDEVFGPEQVSPFVFDPSSFPQGCAVLDFCSRTGIPLPVRRVRRINDGLSFEALKLLYAYRRWGEGYGVGLPAMIRNEILFRRLAELRGPSIRFHSRLVEPFASTWREQLPQLEQRLGKSLWEDLRKHDTGDCVGEESDLWRFSPESLAWLSRASGMPPIKDQRGESAARQVSQQMQHLCHHPTLDSRIRWHRLIGSRRLAQWLGNV
jgi:hypothetical protein